MKKILLLLLSGLLITCIAGSAIAVPGTTERVVTDEDLIQTDTSDDVVVVPENSQTTVVLDLTGLPSGLAGVRISVSDPGYQVTIPKEGKFNSRFISDQDLIVTYNDPFVKSMWLPDSSIHYLTVKNIGATGNATLSVTVDGENGRRSCS